MRDIEISSISSSKGAILFVGQNNNSIEINTTRISNIVAEYNAF